MQQFVILRTALDNFHPSAALVDGSSTERVGFRKHTWISLQSFSNMRLWATDRSFAFHWGLLLWQESWIVDFPYRLAPHHEFSMNGFVVRTHTTHWNRGQYDRVCFLGVILRQTFHQRDRIGFFVLYQTCVDYQRCRQEPRSSYTYLVHHRKIDLLHQGLRSTRRPRCERTSWHSSCS